ncbi:uncharacterized protein LOC114248426 [Bombyx mandarina]|uniref:Uncharacterized protein LOC114247086 n=1 Tax=Bombyx mandarina TaxID=7092 RepID=A0A6J2K0G9_BOMMA|nr:uncharacterized protein LOC114247086 [Bombyx mandarina]XP_028037469.1 uncharacterized protein LOC114248426 [Bombyx mandarina]
MHLCCTLTIQESRMATIGILFSQAKSQSVQILTLLKRTTAFHPSCNGLVKRFHRHPKAAIVCLAKANWTDILPLVLLGIRCAYKEDLKSSSAELVYGETLRLPGQFFDSPTLTPTNDDFIARLRLFAQPIKSQPASRHGHKPNFTFKDLKTCIHVYLRDDVKRRSLQPTYTGLHTVLHRDDKTLTLLIKGKSIKVTLDRVKPAFLLDEQLPKHQPEKEIIIERRTRSGRRVHFPDFYRP